ncbi:endonuclease domain-containing protein [Streptomyces violaceusniger]|uniref:endonuclease domain-containing protein n=1 Tax=Streptomyces violaceusniger TaxID=68280 RepID=UPI003690C874
MCHRLTCDEYDELRERAGGCCEICGTPEAETGGKRLVVDHFEGRGFRLVRGLLCDSCNAVMSCVDGTKRWGVNRRWESEALEYEASSWQQPTPEQRAAVVALQAAQRVRIYRRRRRGV